METRKEFAGLGEDYAFFQAHSSEAQASRDAWVPLLAGRKSPRMLDFGTGPGDYLADFLAQANLQPADLSLVEPDPHFLEIATRRLQAHQSWSQLPQEATDLFDVIVSHHVLYYVPNLSATLAGLWRALAPGGRMILAQGGRHNGLNQIMLAHFQGQKYPYYLSEDTRAALQQTAIPFRELEVEGACQFPDTPQGRRHILRFLLGPEARVELLDPFAQEGKIRIPASDQHFVIDKA